MDGETVYVQLVRLDNGEIWFFKEINHRWVPHNKLTVLIEGEIVEKERPIIS